MFSTAKAQEGLINLPAPTAWNYFSLSDFSGGLNTNTFSGNLGLNQARELHNMVLVNGQMTVRPGYAPFNTTLTSGNRGIKGIFVYNRALDDSNFTIVANNGKLWKSGNSSTFDSIPGSGTLDTTKYVYGLIWKDSLLYLDGTQDPKKTNAKGVVDGTIVVSGKVDQMYPVGEFVRDTTFEPPLNEDAFIRRASPYADTNYGYKKSFPIGIYGGDTVRYLFKLDLSGIQPADSIAYLKISFGGRLPVFSNTDSVFCYRVTSTWSEDTVTWNSKPTFAATPIAKSRILLVPFLDEGHSCSLRLESICDSIVNGSYTNFGFMLTVRETADSPSRFYINSRESPIAKPSIKTSIVWSDPTTKGKPRHIVDSLLAGKFPDNDLVGFFFYSREDSLYRQIIANRFNTLVLDVPIIDAKWETNGHKGNWDIYARPSSKDNLDTGSVDSVTAESAGDSLWRIWVGTRSSITTGQYKNGLYYLKVTLSKGGAIQGNHLILDNQESSTKDYFKLFVANKYVVGVGTKWEIFQVDFPTCQYITAKGNRVYYAQSDKPYIWFSEANNTAQVETDNFYVITGDPQSSKITALFTLSPTALSGYSDQQTPVFVGTVGAIFGLYGNQPDQDVLQKVSSGVGISFQNSIIHHPEGIDFMNYKGLAYRFNGRDLNKLSLTIPDRFDAISTIAVTNIAGFYLNGVDYWWASNATTGIGYTLSVENNAWSNHNLAFGIALRQHSASDSIPVLFGSLSKGRIYKFGREITDKDSVSTANISAYYTSPWFDLGNPAITKEFRDVTMTYRGLSTYPPSLIILASNSVFTTVVIDTVTFSPGFAYYDHVERIGFNSGIIGKMVSFKITVNNVFKLGKLDFKFMPLKRDT